MSLLGLDVGTTGTKALIFSTEGRTLASAYREYDIVRPASGRAEFDAAAVWRSISECIATVAGECPGGDPVEAIGVASLGEAMVPVTADRRIIGASLLNVDTRGNEYLPGLRAALSDRRIYELNGNPWGEQYGATKLMWIREHDPELYERAAYFLHWGSLVAFMLGAEPAVDYSLANRSLLLDLERKDWSDELLRACGLDREKLPRPVRSGTVIGSVSAEAAHAHSLAEGIPIVAGAHDQIAGATGTGAVTAGTAFFGMGTFPCLAPIYDRRGNTDAMLELGLNTEDHAVSGLYASFIYHMGGATVRWFRDVLAGGGRGGEGPGAAGAAGEANAGAGESAGGPGDAGRSGDRPAAGGGASAGGAADAGGSAGPANSGKPGGSAPAGRPAPHADYASLFAEMPAGPSGLLVLPHFAPMGPPDFLSDRSAAILGLTLETSRAAILKAIIEANAMEHNVVVSRLPEAGIEIERARVVGAGSRSDETVQVHADVFGIPLLRMNVTEAGALGAAVLAGVGAGVFSSVGEAVGGMIGVEREFEPDPGRHALYRELFGAYREARQRVGTQLTEWESLRRKLTGGA